MFRIIQFYSHVSKKFFLFLRITHEEIHNYIWCIPVVFFKYQIPNHIIPFQTEFPTAQVTVGDITARIVAVPNPAPRVRMTNKYKERNTPSHTTLNIFPQNTICPI